MSYQFWNNRAQDQNITVYSKSRICGLKPMSSTRYDLGQVPSTSLQSISISTTLLHRGFHMVFPRGFSGRILYAAFILASLHTFCWLSHHNLLDFIIQTIPYLHWCYVLSRGNQFLMFQTTALVPPSPEWRCPKKSFLDCVTMKTHPMTQHNIPEDLNLQQH